MLAYPHVLKRIALAVALVVSVVGMVTTPAVAGAAPARQRASCGSWTIVPSSTSPSLSIRLSAVAAASTTNAWAVGAFPDTFNIQHTLIEHWDGATWTLSPSPDPAGATNVYLSAVATVKSSPEAWAVGSFINGAGVSSGVALHWNGTQWSIVPTANPAGSTDYFLSSVVTFSSTNVWAIGSSYSATSGYMSLAEHWNGTSWRIMPATGSTPHGYSAATRVPGTSEVWATGLGGVALRNQGTWSTVPDATRGGGAVTALSSTNAWIVGPYQSSERWNGVAWTAVPVPNPVNPNGAVYLTAVVALSANNVWAVGYYNNGPTYYTLMEQWNGTAWNVIPSADPGVLNDLAGVTRVPGTSQMWAVGSYSNSVVTVPLIEHYC